MKVVIVEDEMLIAQVTKMQLERSGLQVIGMARSPEAFWKIMNDSVDIILMDVKLKRDESGIKLAKDVKLKYPKLPIIFTTGNTRKFVEQELGGTENVRILSKPLVYSELIDTIKSLTITEKSNS